jgi:NADPH:quinone reductase-like Zn-dependent oxidoreductase
MQAIAYHEYGSPDVLHLEGLPKPVPGPGEVLLRVRAASVNPIDWHFMRGSPYGIRFMTGLRKPKSPLFGIDVAGQVEEAGGNVTQFKPGDEVFGACRAAFAEYACAPASTLTQKPSGISFEQAASGAVAGFTALQSLRDKARMQAGQKVLINGASGGVGTFAVQIARHFGAEVTGICSTRNLELVHSLGADRVIDYTQEDFTRSPRRYDVFLDCIGNHAVSVCRRVLTSTGTYIMVGAPTGKWIAPMDRVMYMGVLSLFVRQKLLAITARANPPDLAFLADLMASGEVSPVIDRSYRLAEVPDAIRYLETGHARGKIVIIVD